MPADPLSRLLQEQPHVRAALGAVVEGRIELSHAYLLTGPGGSGKATLAAELAAAALAAPHAAGPIAPASVDEELRGRIARRAHPDLAWIAPTSGAGILVEDVEQQILSAAGATPLVAARRVFVIEQVERLGDAAANRLLKTLEEPPAYVHLLLLSSAPQQVMATIRSRCQEVRLSGPSQAQTVERLTASGIDPTVARSAAAIAGADGDRAAFLADPAQGGQLRAVVEAFTVGALRAGRPAPWAPILDHATTVGEAAADAVREAAAEPLEHLEGRDRSAFERTVEERAKRAARQARTLELDAALQLAGTWVRDLWALSLGAEDAVRGVDRLPLLRELAEELGGGPGMAPLPARLADAIVAVQEARRALEVNATEGLLLDALSVRLGALAQGTAVPT